MTLIIISLRRTGMITMVLRLVTTVTVALSLLLQNAERSSGSPEEDEPASVTSLPTSLADVVLVSYQKPWNEAHASFARLLDATVTTWHVTNRALRSYLVTSLARGKRPLFVAADPGEPFETVLTLSGAPESACVPWLFLRHHSRVHANFTGSWQPVKICDVVGVLGMNSTAIRAIFWPFESAIEKKPRSKQMLGRLRIGQHLSAKSLSGKRLEVACRVAKSNKTRSSCNTKRVRHIFELLESKNVTVIRVPRSGSDAMWAGTYANEWSMAFELTAIKPSEVIDFDFPFIFLVHRTFYSRVNDLRVVTLSEVAGESWKLVATTVVFLAIFAAVTVVIGAKSWSALRGFPDMMTLLLATMLANSASEPSLLRRVSGHGRVLLGLCLLSILPLSVYFRSELTSIVTIRRPAYRIDTLEKLEDALDRREVAPCVVANTTNYFEISKTRDIASQTSLRNKLQSAFARHGDRELATRMIAACLHCAYRRNRVCYNSLEYVGSDIIKNFPKVRPFVEHMKMQPAGYRMHKYANVYKPMRRLFLAIEEQRLTTWFDSGVEYKDVHTKFDVSSVFLQHFILLMVCCFVLLLEVLVAWCLRRTSGGARRS